MKKWLMIGFVLVMAGVTYAQIPQQEISRLITSLVDWRQQAVSPGVSFPTTCRTYWNTAGQWQYSCNGAPFATWGAGTVTGSGTAHTVPIWTSASALGDSGITDDGTTVLVASTGSTFDNLTINEGGLDASHLGNRNLGGIDTQAVGEQIDFSGGSSLQGIGNQITATGSDNQFLGEVLNDGGETNAVLIGQNIDLTGTGLSSAITLGIGAPDIAITGGAVNLGPTGSRPELRFYDSNGIGGAKWIGFKAPATVTTAVTWTLPVADGAAESFFKTDGAGTIGFTAAGKTQAYVVCTGVACATSCTLTFTKGLLTANSGTCP